MKILQSLHRREVRPGDTQGSTVGFPGRRMLSVRLLPPGRGRDAANLSLIEVITSTPNITATTIVANGQAGD